MTYKRLYIWHEGPRDKDFFQAVFEPDLREKFDRIDYISYSGKSHKSQMQYLRALQHTNFFYFKDYDTADCISSIKADLIKVFGNRINKEQILIVKSEIESWYLAIANIIYFNLTLPSDTEHITKESFQGYIPKSYDGSALFFMSDILKNFDLGNGLKCNRSLNYVYQKLNSL